MATENSTAIMEMPDNRLAWAAIRRARGSGVLEEGTLSLEDVAGLKRLQRTSVALAVPSQHMIMRVLDLPETDAAERASMVGLQVDKFSPFPVDQMVVSHEVLARHAGGCAVLVAAARESVIGQSGESARAAGVRMARVDALLLGRWRTLTDGGHLAGSGREMLALLEDGCLDVLTHEAGVPVSLGSLGEVADPDDPGVARGLAQEIAHLMVGLDAERGPASEPVVTVWSAGGSGSALAAALGERLECPVREASLDSLESALAGVARRQADSGAGKEVALDLTPASWREMDDLRRFRRRLWAAGAVLLGGWLLLSAGGWGTIAWQRARTARLQAEDQRWLEPANAVRRMRLQSQMIRRYMDRRTSALECLREISILQPEGVDLTSFTYRKDDGLELVGEANSGSLVIAYNERLNASPLFAEVKAGPRTLTPRQRHRFSFEVKFKGKETP